LLAFLTQSLDRRNANDVTFAHTFETLHLQHDVERLVPGNVEQPQGDGSLHVVGGDDVQVADIRQQAARNADDRILEIERNRLSLIDLLAAAERPAFHQAGETESARLDLRLGSRRRVDQVFHGDL